MPPLQVLVIDDSAVLCEIVETELEAVGGLAVTTCHSVASACAALDKQNFALIIADYSLDGRMTAVDLLVVADVREAAPRSKRYILSGYSQKELAPKFAATTVHRFYAKPTDFVQLVADIKGDFGL